MSNLKSKKRNLFSVIENKGHCISIDIDCDSCPLDIKCSEVLNSLMSTSDTISSNDHSNGKYLAAIDLYIELYGGEDLSDLMMELL